MLTIIQRQFFLKAASVFYLLSPSSFASATIADAEELTASTHEQNFRRQQDVANVVHPVPMRSPTGLGGPSPMRSPIGPSPSLVSRNLPNSFDIELQASTQNGWTVSSTIQDYFDNAANRWNSIFSNDLTDYSTGSLAGTLTGSGGGQFGQCIYPAMIDDLWICVSACSYLGADVISISGPLDRRPLGESNGLPATGRIVVNSNLMGDLTDAVLRATIGSVLGIGTLWDTYGLATSPPPPCAYTSAPSSATFEYRAISGCISDFPPLEDMTGDELFDCVHWSESCFVNELMTPFIAAGDPISRVTIGTLEDLGYEVDYSAADPYTTFNPACTCARDPASTGDETTTSMTTTSQQGGERRHKRSLNDSDHPDAKAIAKAKTILASMMNETEAPVGGSNITTPTANLWVNIVTYDADTEMAHSYIITPKDL